MSRQMCESLSFVASAISFGCSMFLLFGENISPVERFIFLLGTSLCLGISHGYEARAKRMDGGDR